MTTISPRGARRWAQGLLAAPLLMCCHRAPAPVAAVPLRTMDALRRTGIALRPERRAMKPTAAGQRGGAAAGWKAGEPGAAKASEPGAAAGQKAGEPGAVARRKTSEPGASAGRKAGGPGAAGEGSGRAPGTGAQSAATTPVPPVLAPIAEVRLLATRLGRAPSLALGCAPIGAEDGEQVSACLGKGLPAPLGEALITEQVRGQRVVGVSAEETYAGALAERAPRRFAGLAAQLSRSYGPPADGPEAGVQQVRHQAGPYAITLEISVTGAIGTLIYLELRERPEQRKGAAQRWGLEDRKAPAPSGAGPGGMVRRGG